MAIQTNKPRNASMRETKLKDHSRTILASYLERHGYGAGELQKIGSGFDLSHPVYEQKLDDRAMICQFVRNPSADRPLQKLGNWFCLRGAGMEGLAIFGGGEGRSIAVVRVEIGFIALEGTAAEVPRNWANSIGGPGGLTQIFVPDKYLMTNLRVLGYQ